MNRKTVLIIMTMAVFLALLLPTVCMGEGLEVGADAPFFKIKSGDGKELTLDMIKGKVTVIFYENKDIVEENRKLKNELKDFHDQQPDNVKELSVELPVIDCSGAFWPFAGIWKGRLRENSEKEGIIIYGDWDGKMKSVYRIKDKESNVIIIDKKGAVRHFSSGEVEDKEIDKIKELLEELGSEEM